jgi:hypothetical protein
LRRPPHTLLYGQIPLFDIARIERLIIRPHYAHLS